MADYERTVAAWYAELRGGSSITWAEHLATGTTGDGTPIRVDAAHLELVRRLALRLGDDPGFAELADRVVGTAAFGRGRVDIPLPLPGALPVSGSPAIDPGEVPAGELLRVAVPVLAGLLPVPEPTESTRVRGRGPRVVVHGNPGLADPLRTALRAAGVREGGRSALHVVLAAPLDVAVFSLWTARVRGGAAVRWRRLWERLAEGELPPGVDPGSILDELHTRVRSDRIHLVVADSRSVAAARVGAWLGVDLAEDVQPTWAEVDLARRLNWFHAARMDAAERAAYVSGLLEFGQSADAGVPDLPRGLRPWARTTAAAVAGRLADRARSGGYAVHGDLEEVGRLVSGRARTGPAATLDAAVEAIARAFTRGR